MRAEWYCLYLNRAIADVTNRMPNICRTQSHRHSTYNLISTRGACGTAEQLRFRRFCWYYLRVNSAVIELEMYVIVDHVESACLLMFHLNFVTFRLSELSKSILSTQMTEHWT